jgi:hypothetical protein
MGLIVEYDGEDITGQLRLESGIQGLTSAADGQFESAAIKIDDEAGARVITPWQLMTADEDDCDLPRIWTGYLFQEDADRGLEPHAGASRDYTGQLADLNVLLHMQPARGADAKRPVETGNARMAWLMASVAMNGVFDGGLIGDNPNMFDAADYNDPPAYADEILQDLCVSSSDDEPGRIFCVLWDQDDERPILFMDVPTAAVYDSELSISNDLADVDPFGPTAEVFYPHPDAQLTGQGSDIYCSVFFIYKTGRYFLHNQDTHDEFFGHDSINHRQAVYSTSRVGSLETAQRHAAQYLANHNGKKDTIVCRIIVPKEQVNKLDVAMRVQVKFTHFRGFESFTWTRVQRRTVLLNANPARTDQYEMVLELSVKGFAEGGGGPAPGDFPAPPPTAQALSLVQVHTRQSSGGAHSDYGTYPTAGHTWVAPTAGDLLVLGVTAYDNGTGQDIPTPSGWTAATAIFHPTGFGTSADYSGRFFYKLADGSEAIGDFATGFDDQTVVIAEFDQGGTFVTGVTGANGPPGIGSGLNGEEGNRSPTFAALSVTAGAPVTVIGWWCQTGPTGLVSTSGATTQDQAGASDVGHPSGGSNLGTALIVYPVTSSSGTERLTGLMYNNNNFQFHATLAFTGGTGTSDNPPGSGQLVTWTEVAMSPSGGVSVGTTAFPYAPLSLLVKVDGVLISPASYTETDPNAGDFALAWLLDGDETVLVQYQAL